MARISVIIPTHNRAALLPRAVESALAAGREIEAIVVDDASSDETSRVCSRLAGIQYLRLNRNEGLAAARNAGIRASSADYLAFLDDDDVRLPGSLDRQVSVLEEEPAAALCYGRVQFAAARDGRLTGEVRPRRLHRGDIFWRLLAYNFIYVPSTVVRRRSLFEAGLFELDLEGVEDWYLWLRLAEEHPVLAVDDPLAIYRLADSNSGQMTSNQARMSAASERARVKAFCLTRVVEAPTKELIALERLRRNLRSDRLIWSAASALNDGKPRLALTKLFEALHVNPMRASRPWTFRLLFSSIVRLRTGR